QDPQLRHDAKVSQTAEAGVEIAALDSVNRKSQPQRKGSHQSCGGCQVQTRSAVHEGADDVAVFIQDDEKVALIVQVRTKRPSITGISGAGGFGIDEAVVGSCRLESLDIDLRSGRRRIERGAQRQKER